MAATTKQLIESALRKLGVLEAGERAQPDMFQDALVDARQMIDSWELEGLKINAYTNEKFIMDAAKRSYSIGPGGDFDTVRPTTIEHANMIDLAGLSVNVDVVGLDIWREIEWKDSQEYTPDYLYYEPSHPVAYIHLSSLPFDNYQLDLMMLKPIADLPDLTEEMTYPPGYERMLKWGLMMELAPEYGKSVPREAIQAYREAVNNVKHINAVYRQRTLEMDAGLVRPQRYDITQGPGVR